MSVYVDSLMPWGAAKVAAGKPVPRCFRDQPSCHMYADTPEELHAMAKQIDMKHSWFQPEPIPHYDLVEVRRTEAVRLGAIEHGRRESVAKWRELRGV